MKQHTINYFDTFIVMADDSPVSFGEIPPQKGNAKSAANIQFELIYNKPYKYSSDDVLFLVFAVKNGLPKSDYKEARENYFSKGQPCFRASPLTKRYGWGVHYNADGKMAIYGAETDAYKKFSADKKLKVLKAMKSSK